MPLANTQTRKRKTTLHKTRKSRQVGGSFTSFSELATIFEGINGWGGEVAGYKTTYGEVTPIGIQALEKHFTQASPVSALPQDQRVFYDLGCGVGKVVVGMAMLRPELQSCVGIEIVPRRIEGAQQALAKVKNKGVAARCSFQVASFLAPEMNFRNAGWIYISNLCFDNATQRALAEKLQKECRPGCAVACSKALPWPEGGRVTTVNASAHVPMSWSQDSKVLVYRLGSTS